MVPCMNELSSAMSHTGHGATVYVHCARHMQGSTGGSLSVKFTLCEGEILGGRSVMHYMCGQPTGTFESLWAKFFVPVCIDTG